MKPRLAPAVVLLAFLPVGCGGDNTETVTERTVITQDDDPPTTTAQTQPTTTPSDAATAFTTPSGNIVCNVTAQEARCGILDFDYTPPAQPSSCTVPG